MFKGSSQDLRSIKVVGQCPRLQHSLAVVGCQTLELGSSRTGQKHSLIIRKYNTNLFWNQT